MAKLLKLHNQSVIVISLFSNLAGGGILFKEAFKEVMVLIDCSNT